jgi:hypothetical protein
MVKTYSGHNHSLCINFSQKLQSIRNVHKIKYLLHKEKLFFFESYSHFMNIYGGKQEYSYRLPDEGLFWQT